MLISLEVDGVSPRLELTRDGNNVTLDLKSGANGYYDEELGYWIWDGDIEATLGTVTDYFFSDFDRPLDLTLTETLTPGVAVDGSYAINYGALTSSFKVSLFYTSTNYNGTSGIDYVFGSNDRDTLSGGAGNDGLDGGAGDDVLKGGKGGDHLEGGTGRDIASYAGASGAVDVRLYDSTLNAGEAQGDRFVSIEVIEGSKFNDHLYGDAAANILWGRNGADTLFGMKGNDVLAGGQGADLLLGDIGIDTASYFDALAGVRANLTTGTGTGGDAAGDRYWSIENMIGSSYDDTLTGSAVANTILGRSGDDDLRGQAGDDRLLGGAGGDGIFGGAGNDTINGGAGYDRLTGNLGADVFVFDSSPKLPGNTDRIFDYSIADDQIQLSGKVFTALTPGGVLSSDAFVLGAFATTADHRIIYNAATGALLYDPDGDGAAAAIHLANLSSGLGMTNAEFEIV